MTNVTCLKTTYMTCNLTSLELISYLTTATKGAMKWAISRQACSRVKKFVAPVNALSISLNSGSQKIEENKFGLPSVLNVRLNGTKNIMKKMLSYIKNQTEKEPSIIGLLKNRVFSQVPKNTRYEKPQKTEKPFSGHTEISVPVVEKITLCFSRSIMSTVMVILNAKAGNIQAVRNFMLTLSSKAFQRIISCSVITVISEGLAITESALIKKVQRLSRKGVRPSGRKCALPYLG